MAAIGPDGLPVDKLPLAHKLNNLRSHLHELPVEVGTGLTATYAECSKTDAGRLWWTKRGELVRAILLHPLPNMLTPLFSIDAILYAEEVARQPVLASLLVPSPDDDRLRDKADDDERLRRTVMTIFSKRNESRAFGALVGSPGQGKTYMMRLLLRSFVDPDFAASLAPEVREWWRGMAVHVISYNGRTPASYIDLELVNHHPQLSNIVRLLYIEMHTSVETPSWEHFQLTMWRLVQEGNDTVLLLLAGYVLKVRQRDRAHSAVEHFVGVLLADELLRVSNKLSLQKDKSAGVAGATAVGFGTTAARAGATTSRTSAPTGDRATDGAGTWTGGPGRSEGIPGSAAVCATFDGEGAAEGDTTTDGADAAAGAAGALDGDDAVGGAAVGPATAIGVDTVPASGARSTRRAAARSLTAAERDAQALTKGGDERSPAQLLRSMLCAWGAGYNVFVCISSLSRAFVEEQCETPSGSVQVKLGEQHFMESQRIRDATVCMLTEQAIYVHVTQRSDSKGVLSAVVVGSCLGTLAGGHPRAAVLLLKAMEKCDVGSPYFSRFISALDPSELSIARSSIDVLLSNSVGVAVGLLGYDPEPSAEVKAGLSWDAIYTSGALTRTKETVAMSTEAMERRPSTRALTRYAPSSSTSCFTTRLNLSFLLEALKKRENTRRAPQRRKRRRLHEPLPGDDLFDALEKVRCAFEKGDAAVAWEDFSLWALSSVCAARHVCSTQLGAGILKRQLQGAHGNMSLLELFPSSPPFVGDVTWMETAQVDAACHRRGVEYFDSLMDLLKKDEAALLDVIWKPKSLNFPAFDGVLFVKCTEADKTCGPCVGDLVAVLLQLKYKKTLDMRKDVKDCCVAGIEQFSEIENGKSWNQRAAFVLLSHEEQTRDRAVDLASMPETATAIVVDGPHLAHVFGPCLYGFVESSSVLFGAQVLENEIGAGNINVEDKKGSEK